MEINFNVIKVAIINYCLWANLHPKLHSKFADSFMYYFSDDWKFVIKYGEFCSCRFFFTSAQCLFCCLLKLLEK